VQKESLNFVATLLTFLCFIEKGTPPSPTSVNEKGTSPLQDLLVLLVELLWSQQ
jgi:hypothetical protein